MDPEEFLTVSDQFRLGDLITEQPHPETIDLAELAQTDLLEAIDAFHRVDCRAISALLLVRMRLLDRITDTLRPAVDAVPNNPRLRDDSDASRLHLAKAFNQRAFSLRFDGHRNA